MIPTRFFAAVIGFTLYGALASTDRDEHSSSITPVTITTDTGLRGGHVNLEALPSLAATNSLKKRVTVDSLRHVQSAELLLFGALRDPTDQDSFASETWEWIFFSLNGHEWVLQIEDVPMLRKSLFEVNWDDVYWASIKVPDVNYLKQGVNELVIWNNNPPDHRKNKYLVVAYDDSGKWHSSVSMVNGQWSNDDLNGDRDGTPRGECMIRLKLNRLKADQQRIVDSLGSVRYQQAVENNEEYVWGFTDAVHRVFPDRPCRGCRLARSATAGFPDRHRAGHGAGLLDHRACSRQRGCGRVLIWADRLLHDHGRTRGHARESPFEPARSQLHTACHEPVPNCVFGFAGDAPVADCPHEFARFLP